MNRTIKYADLFGITASGLCMVHCLAMPFLYFLIPFIGITIKEDFIHRVMIVFITLPVIFALVPGFLKHRRKSSLVFGMLGLFYFCMGVFYMAPRYGQTGEIILTVIGGLHLIIAHCKNRTFCSQCEICSSSER